MFPFGLAWLTFLQALWIGPLIDYLILGALGQDLPPALFRGWAPESAGELGPFGGTGSPPSVVAVRARNGREDGFPVSPLSELGSALFGSRAPLAGIRPPPGLSI